MPRRTYDKRNGRPRPSGQRSGWDDLRRHLHALSYARANPQTPGDQRRNTEENQA